MGSTESAQPSLLMRFKEVSYAIETGEAEMISVDFVARGGGNATIAKESQKKATEAKGKGKSNAGDAIKDETISDVQLLSPEDEELISSLTTKANAIRMLQERVALTKAYLSSIPPCYLNTPPSDASTPVEMPSDQQISHPILRNVSSMLTRLPLLTPPTSSTPADRNGTTTLLPGSVFSHEAAQQRSDVALIGLLGSLGSTIRTAQDMGKKAAVVEKSKSQAASSKSFDTSYGRNGGFLQPQMMPMQHDTYVDFVDDEAYDDGDGDEIPDAEDGGVSLDGELSAPSGLDRAGQLPPAGKAFLDGRLKRNFGDDEEMT